MKYNLFFALGSLCIVLITGYTSVIPYINNESILPADEVVTKDLIFHSFSKKASLKKNGYRNKDSYLLFKNGEEYRIFNKISGAFDEDRFLSIVKKGDTLSVDFYLESSIVQVAYNNLEFINEQERTELMQRDRLAGIILAVCFFLAFVYFTVVAFK